MRVPRRRRAAPAAASGFAKTELNRHRLTTESGRKSMPVHHAQKRHNPHPTWLESSSVFGGDVSHRQDEASGDGLTNNKNETHPWGAAVRASPLINAFSSTVSPSVAAIDAARRKTAGFAAHSVPGLLSANMTQACSTQCDVIASASSPCFGCLRGISRNSFAAT